MSELHVYMIDEEWHIAESPADALQSWKEWSGEDTDGLECKQLDDDIKFTVTYHDEYDLPKPLPDGAIMDDDESLSVTATCAAWCANRGRGPLATSEW